MRHVVSGDVAREDVHGWGRVVWWFQWPVIRKSQPPNVICTHGKSTLAKERKQRQPTSLIYTQDIRTQLCCARDTWMCMESLVDSRKRLLNLLSQFSRLRNPLVFLVESACYSSSCFCLNKGTWESTNQSFFNPPSRLGIQVSIDYLSCCICCDNYLCYNINVHVCIYVS